MLKVFALTSHTIADVFLGSLKGILLCFKLKKKLVTAFRGGKKRWSLFYVDCDTKTQTGGHLEIQPKVE
jgi:hypothetical protein